MPCERRDKMTFGQIVDLVILVVKIILEIIETMLAR
jgi:hypothetical protein